MKKILIDKINSKIIFKYCQIILFTVISSNFCHAQWSAPVCISPAAMSAGLNENMGPCLASSGDTLHVVWSDKRTQGYAIYYTHSTDTGLTWSNAVPITDTTGRATMPVIAVSGSTVHVVWMDSLLGIRASFYKRSLDGGNTWGPPVCLDSNTKFWPGIACSGSMVLASLDKEVVAGNTEVFLMRSFDNGATWGPEQQISNAAGRSEDQAMATDGANIHMTWNDKRSGTMQIYYCHSSDSGATWGAETAVFTTASYSTMVCLDSAYVDVACGNSSAGNFDVLLRQSSDTCSTWGSIIQLTDSSAGEAYPYMIRDRENLHLAYLQFGSPSSVWYLYSGDGGTTWNTALLFGFGGQPFLALTCPVLHVIWPNSGAIYYLRNPTANPCQIITAIQDETITNPSENTISVYPNPFSFETTINISSSYKISNAELKIYNVFGNEVSEMPGINSNEIIFKRGNLSNGIYFYQLKNNHTVFAKGKIILQ